MQEREVTPRPISSWKHARNGAHMVTKQLIDGRPTIVKDDASMKNAKTVVKKVTGQLFVGRRRNIKEYFDNLFVGITLCGEVFIIYDKDFFKELLWYSGVSSHTTHIKI